MKFVSPNNIKATLLSKTLLAFYLCMIYASISIFTKKRITNIMKGCPFVQFHVNSIKHCINFHFMTFPYKLMYGIKNLSFSLLSLNIRRKYNYHGNISSQLQKYLPYMYVEPGLSRNHIRPKHYGVHLKHFIYPALVFHIFLGEWLS